MHTRFVLIAVALCLPAFAQQTITVRPREIDTVLANPGTGFVTNQSFNDDRGAAPLLMTASLPPSTLAYFRFYWSELEPAQGKYDWRAIDKALAGAREHGQTLMLRVAPYGPGNGVPAWYRELSASKTAVDPEDPNYARHFGGLIRALGRRYDGHPDLEVVDVAIVARMATARAPRS